MTTSAARSCDFASGATGSIEGNWIATGRKMQHDFEVYGTKGALAFSQERFNELHFFSTDDRRGRQGFRRIEAGPDHPPYGLFCVAPGHQLGFNDLKAIEVAGFLDAVAGSRPEPFNFRAGLRIQTLVETIHASSSCGRLEGGSLNLRADADALMRRRTHARRCCTASLFGDNRYPRVYRILLEPRGQGDRERLREAHWRRKGPRERVFVLGDR